MTVGTSRLRHVYPDWGFTKDMMRIADHWVDCAGFLIGDRPDAKSGRGAIGTFFLIQEDHVGFDYTPDDVNTKFMVTARHVVENQKTLEAVMVNHNTKRVKHWKNVSDGWRYPDDSSGLLGSPRTDLAVRVHVTETVGYRAIPLDWRVEVAAEDYVGFSELGRPIYFMGLLDWTDRLANEAVPVVRTGSLAAMKKEEIVWEFPRPDFDGKPEDRWWTAAQTHLVDVRSYQGFSGGPAFIQYVMPHAKNYRSWPVQWTYWAERTGKEVFDDPDYLKGFGSLQTFTHWMGMYAAYDKERGIGCVVPSEVIYDFLQTEELMKDKKKRAKELMEQRLADGPKGQSVSTTPDQFMDDLRKATRRTGY